MRITARNHMRLRVRSLGTSVHPAAFQHSTFVRHASIACIALVLLGLCGPAGAWQRPKASDELPPLRKPASGEPQLLTPPLDAAPVSIPETEAEEEEAEIALPALAPASAERPASAAPAGSSNPAGRNPGSNVSILGEGDDAPGRLTIEARPLRSVSSTLAQAATFRGVTPGKTRRAELIAAWGQPEVETADGDQVELKYAIPPFHQVHAVLENDLVACIFGRYETPAVLKGAADTLAVSRFTPAVIRDEDDKLLGQIYPERGILFGLTGELDDLRVTQVVFASPSAEGFLTRAEQQSRRSPEASLTDAKAARELAPDNVRAQALLLRMLLGADRASEALSAAEEILQESPDNVQARLTLGRASLHLSRWRVAEREARALLEQPELSKVDRAAAQLLLGDVLVRSPQHDVRGAMTHHHGAAQDATAAVQETNPGPARQDALQIAVEAYLAVAEDLAAGNWRRREESFAQWISHAERVVESLAATDSKEDWRFHVRRRALEAAAASGGKIEPASFAAAAMEFGSRMIAAVPDPHRRAELQAALGESLLESSQAMMIAGQHAAGRNYIFDAQRLLEAAKGQHATPRTEHLLGRAYFFRGLDKAVGEGDHAAAAEWYARAAPLLDRPIPLGRLTDSGAHGQRLVTMSVSLWQAEQREQAISLTEKGLRYIQEAVDRAELERTALAAPLANLAHMNRLLGNEAKAKMYQTRLVDFQTPVEEPESEQE
jgi:tetratricopeptide (TPR) repeat protein